MRPAARWAATLASVGLIVAALGFRADPASPEPSASPEPEVSATAMPPIDVGGIGLTEAELSVPRRPPPPPASPTPSPPTPAPLPEPTPGLTPAPVAEAPPAAPPPADNGAGGGLAPRTAPPGWTPPAQLPGDTWTTGAFGQTLSAGGITVTAHRLPLDTDASGCDTGNPLPPGSVWTGFSVTTTWSGFSLPNYGAGAPNQGPVTCWLGSPSPLVSGVPHQVFLQVPAGSAATTSMNVGYFPNGSSPAYIFDFH